MIVTKQRVFNVLWHCWLGDEKGARNLKNIALTVPNDSLFGDLA